MGCLGLWFALRAIGANTIGAFKLLKMHRFALYLFPSKQAVYITHIYGDFTSSNRTETGLVKEKACIGACTEKGIVSSRMDGGDGVTCESLDELCPAYNILHKIVIRVSLDEFW